MTEPRQREIWWVALDPTRGSEIRKTRPAVIISGDHFPQVPIRLVVPITTWHPRFETHANRTYLRPTSVNGLRNPSAADLLQVRAVALERFGAKLGDLERDAFQTVLKNLQLVLWDGT